MRSSASLALTVGKSTVLRESASALTHVAAVRLSRDAAERANEDTQAIDRTAAEATRAVDVAAEVRKLQLSQA